MPLLRRPLSLSSLVCFLVSAALLVPPSTSSPYSFVYAGCSQQKYTQGTIYESNVNSALASLVNSATSSNFNNFKIDVPGSTADDVVYSLYQCRGDLTYPECHECVSRAASRLGTTCALSTGGGLQLEGCFVKYDSTPFLGVEDKAVVLNKCGPPATGPDAEGSTRREAVMGYLTAGGSYFRLGGSGNLQGMTQCTQDLSMGECQDCLSEAIGRLRSECGSAGWGDVYLGKCYARYSERGEYSRSGERWSGRWRRWWFTVLWWL